MSNIHIDFIRENKPPRSGTRYASVTLAAGQPIADVGDTVVLFKGKTMKGLRIERRNFYYLKDSTYVQLFFKRAESS